MLSEPSGDGRIRGPRHALPPLRDRPPEQSVAPPRAPTGPAPLWPPTEVPSMLDHGLPGHRAVQRIAIRTEPPDRRQLDRHLRRGDVTGAEASVEADGGRVPLADGYVRLLPASARIPELDVGNEHVAPQDRDE